MSEVIAAYPLQWPTGWKRMAPQFRADGRFRRASRGSGQTWQQQRDLTITEAVTRVRLELQRFGVLDGDMVISTNVPTRLDGFPRGDAKQPDDPGAAVYWRLPHSQATRCMAIDRYAKVQNNLAAIAATLEAMRAIERHGGAEILDRAFTGFAALPGPNAPRGWREVFGCGSLPATLADVQAVYRALAKANHPDKGGDHDRMAEINRAWQQAQEELA